MDLYMIVLRIVHFFSGVFWVGTIFFFTLFLLPRVKQAGQLGGQFMQRLSAPPLPQTMSISGGLVVLSGLLLYGRDSGGFRAAWVGTPTGLAFLIGGLLAIGALSIGIFVSRPAADRMGKLGKEIAASGGPPSPAQMAEVQALSAKLERGVYQTAYMLLVTLLTMSIARYL
ncbi:MAG TPA: hypothetical protein VGR25_11545 [bacterium]|jgi:hypothetical protein|nr:hypothetical protein [bacterium]